MRSFGPFLFFAIVAAIVMDWWPYILGFGFAVLIAWLARELVMADRRSQAQEMARLNAIRRRADQQHNWVMRGDPRGTYGPEITKSPRPRPGR